MTLRRTTRSLDNREEDGIAVDRENDDVEKTKKMVSRRRQRRRCHRGEDDTRTYKFFWEIKFSFTKRELMWRE